MDISRRLAASTMAVVLLVAGPRAQEPTLAVVLQRAAAYLAQFHQQLSGIVAEETYTQAIFDDFPRTPRVGPNGVDTGSRQFSRKLKSDLLLVRPAGSDRYVEFRDVFEVDGEPVRDRQQRLTQLMQDASPTAAGQMGRIIRESARYNIGQLVRTVNTPLLSTIFLAPENQKRFEFKRSKNTQPVQGALAPPPEDGVFRVSTEMWTIEYRERQKGTVIRDTRGRDLPARGRFWINPETGAVLMSELLVAGDVSATITVSYQSEPVIGFLVPVEMREIYYSGREHIEGSAVYGRFRPVTPPQDLGPMSSR